MNATATKPRVQYGPKGETVTVVKSKDGFSRGFKVVSPTKGVYVVPVGLAGFCVGKDAWMKKLTVKCSDCGTLTPCGELEADSLCQSCYEQAGAENEAQDAEVAK